MATGGSDLFSFACPECAKRLKAPTKVRGKEVRCPKCGATIQVPPANPVRASGAPRSALGADDPMTLSAPAIGDRNRRQQEASSIRALHERQRQESRIGTLRRRLPEDDSPIPFDGVDYSEPQSGPSSAESRTQPQGQRPDATEAERKQAGQPANTKIHKRSIFDDDLPELEQLQELAATPPQNRSPGRNAPVSPLSVAAPPSADDAPNRKKAGKSHPDSSAPSSGPRANGPDSSQPRLKEQEPEPEPDPEYRIACKTCGTAQWVTLSMKGMRMQCPDCFVEFRVPPPPPGWRVKKKKIELDEVDVPLAPPAEDSPEHKSASKSHRTRQMLEKARQELSEEEIEKLYDTDFDTADFVERTFGFLKNSINLSQIGIYGIIFAILSGVAQYGANNTDGFFGRGMLLVVMVLVPIVAILFALPMLSGGLALIEAVANKQKVDEFPAFNMFDNVGEVLLIAAAAAASIVPGFLFGMLVSGSEGHVLLRVSMMMITTFALFPVFLLSMLDNNSLFQPVSTTVLSTVRDAADAWGGYYLKTLVAFFFVMLAWVLLLGRSPLLAALAGALLPLLVFFICQQVGALADAISDHLSFELGPEEEESHESESHRDRIA